MGKQGVDGYRLTKLLYNAASIGQMLIKSKQINANTNATVEAAMANIDAEYEALVASFSLASV